MPSCRPQIPSRRGTRRPRGAKRELMHGAQSTTHPPPTCWGKKRSRTALGSRTHDLSTSSCCTRDWANLAGDGPTGLVAELVLAGGDVADYFRFRAVCRAWRQCSPEPQDSRRGGLDSRFFPRRWIMLDKSSDRRRHRFLNVSTGECIRMDLPELDEHRLLALTPEGLLLLFHEPTLVIRLLNPLTRQLTDLPSVAALLTEEYQRASLRVTGVGLADATTSTVAVRFSDPTVLAVAKPRDERWTVVCHGRFDCFLSFAGRFYCGDRMRLMVLDASGGSSGQKPPRLVVAAEPNSWISFSRTAHTLHLVDNAGELLLVHRSLYSDPPHRNFKRKHDVYRVDLDAGALVPVKGIDFKRRAVFMGRSRSISVAAEAFPSLTADTLYLGLDIYSFADGKRSSDDDDDDEMVHTSSVVDCLSHCIGGMGKHLA